MQKSNRLESLYDRVLVVLAHPDDEAFGCAGLIAIHTRAGAAVTYACATLGEMGRNLGNPPLANRESLPRLREKELRESCRVLGITDLRLLGLRDKTVEFIDPEELVAIIAKLLRETKPSLVITFYPGYAVHPDHNAIGSAAVEAVRRLAPGERPELFCLAFGSRVDELGAPDRVIDITPVQEVKKAAIRAHHSQTQLMLESLTERSQPLQSSGEQMAEILTRERFWSYRFDEDVLHQ